LEKIYASRGEKGGGGTDSLITNFLNLCPSKKGGRETPPTLLLQRERKREGINSQGASLMTHILGEKKKKREGGVTNFSLLSTEKGGRARDV